MIIENLTGNCSVRAGGSKGSAIGMGCLIVLVLNVGSFLSGSISRLVLSIFMSGGRHLAFRT